MPHIGVVAEIPEARRWCTVNVELPLREVNGVLGVQLDQGIVRKVPVNVTSSEE